MDNRALFISRDFDSIRDGGSIVAERNYNLVKEYSRNGAVAIKIAKPDKITLLKNSIFKEAHGFTKHILQKIDYNIGGIEYIWLDGSLYGTLAKIIKQKYRTKIITFFHNVERIYAEQNRQSLLHDYFSKRLAIENENNAIKYSDLLIAINERDAELIERIYNANVDYILKTSFNSIPQDKLLPTKAIEHDSYILFVGSNFFANVEGIEWFICEVAPYINETIKIAGSICDYFNKSNLPANVHMVGFAEDLDDIYRNASAVISPIFSGSGMKTKTVEALRYGKTIIGTKEAFEGIDFSHYPDSCILCQQASDYIKAINDGIYHKYLNTNSLAIFESNYSNRVIAKNLFSYLDSVI